MDKQARRKASTASEFWGKVRLSTDGTVEASLPLADHCSDVAHVFRALVDLPTIRRRLEKSAATSLTEVQCDRLAVLALLHDAGKANLGFQNKVFDARAPRVGHIREIGPLVEELSDLTARALDIQVLASWFDSDVTLGAFLTAAWSHHGTPVRFDHTDRVGNPGRWWQPKGGRDPFCALAELTQRAREVFPQAFTETAPSLSEKPRLQHTFAGLVMLSDWLGSHEGFFPIQRHAGFQAGPAARKALRAVGLDARALQSDLSERTGTFQDRFEYEPRPLQVDIVAPPMVGETARLVIAEAETGSGKTEAALARFYALFERRAVDSLYFALPTRVAARELYGRVIRYVRRAFPDPSLRPVVVLAVPGYAKADDVAVDQILPNENSLASDDARGSGRDRIWAAERPKRFLAATVAVGTIDQALLSVLQVPHSHLRSVCLDRSLLVVDEVHASDAYMRRLLLALLEHHLGVGGWALLLSATLGGAARAELTGQALPSLEAAIAAPYPSLTVGGKHPRGVATSGVGKHVHVRLHPALWNPAGVSKDLIERLEQGARVLVMVNTVARAISLQHTVESLGGTAAASIFKCAGVPCPHHGRFAPADRALLDRAVSERFGRGSAAGPAILIGTQTLEQSLDIDADFLITDLCPMDVLLQRIGRLHRHERARPSAVARAECMVLVPAESDFSELLDSRGEARPDARRAGVGSVYGDLRLLQLTMDQLRATPWLEIPADNRRLVEGASHPERVATLSGVRWDRHAQNVAGSAIAARVVAEFPLLTRFESSRFGEFVFQELPAAARTRLGIDTLQVRLDRCVQSPFGVELAEVTIPGHMAPDRPQDQEATVVTAEEGVIGLSYGGQQYTYTRMGLERTDEPAQ